MSSLNINSISGSLQYMGVRAQTPPNLTVNTIRPTSGDYISYTIGDLWLYQQFSPTVLQEVWQLVNLGYQTATWVMVYPSGGIQLVTDSGTVLPVDGVINANGGLNIMTEANPNGSNNFVINLTNNVTISGFYKTTGGNLQLPKTTSATVGTISINGVPFLSNFGDETNTFLGANAAGLFAVTGTDNTGIGNISLSVLTTGDNNTGCGWAALSELLTGSNNVALGKNAGANYVSSESNNICIGNPGVASENNVMRIGGDTGSGAAQQNTTFISGISGYVSGGTAGIMTINTATAGGDILDRVGVIDPSTAVAGYVLTSTGTTTAPTWQANEGSIVISYYATPGAFSFTKQPKTKWIEIFMWGAGGGGGAAPAGFLTRVGNGGDGGGFLKWGFPAAQLTSPVNGVIGAGGAGGVGGVGTGNGTAGGNTSFGTLNPENGGFGGSQTGSNNGLSQDVFVDGSLYIGLSQNTPAITTDINTAQTGGAGGSGSGGANPGIAGFPIGFSPSGLAGNRNMLSQNGGGGGGGGAVGGGNPTGIAGIGSNILDFQANIIQGGGTAGIESGTLNGGNGSNSFDPGTGAFLLTNIPYVGGNGGGGGGGYVLGTAGGNGGNGGFPGGGGGGAGQANGGVLGNGGNGANGLVVIFEF